jgi:nicotinamidase-related amidase
MTTFTDRPNSALLVIDVQVDVVGEAFNRDQVVANIKTAIERARAAGIQVVWVQHSDEHLAIDSDGWQIVPELEPADSEPIVRKTYKSSFVDTNLESVLEHLGVSKLYICGAESNHCVRHTSHSAFERGYDVTLIGDAHTANSYEWNGHKVSAEQVIDEQNDNFYGYQMPGRLATVLPLEKINF